MDKLYSDCPSKEGIKFYKELYSGCSSKEEINYFKRYLRKEIDCIKGMNENEFEGLNYYFRKKNEQIRKMNKNKLEDYHKRFINFLEDWYKKPDKLEDYEFYGNCKHTRKEKSGDFHRCADCGYHFCCDVQKYSHPDQYKDCEHPVKDDIFEELTCLRCGLRFGFSECEHRRKKRFFDYSDFYCCVDCEYHFVDGDPKYRHPNQYEDCEHSHKEKINDQLTCLRCGLRFNGPPPPPFLKDLEYYKICKHLRMDNINGNIFCADCGLVDRVEPISEKINFFLKNKVTDRNEYSISEKINCFF